MKKATFIISCLAVLVLLSIVSVAQTSSIWVSDSERRNVLQPVYYGQETLQTGKYLEPQPIDGNLGIGSIWISDSLRRNVVRADYDGRELVRAEQFHQPKLIAANPVDGTVWVADKSDRKLVKIDRGGKTLIKLDKSIPIGMVVNPKDGSLWVADVSRNYIIKFDRNGEEIFRVGKQFRFPKSIDIDPLDGSVWAGFEQEIVHFDSDGDIISITLGFSSPMSVSVNPVDGTVWVTDTDHAEVVKLASTGAEMIRIKKSFRRAKRIEATIDGGAWVLDPYHRQVQKLNRQGQIVKTLAKGLGRPYDLEYDADKDILWVSTKDYVIKYSSEGEELLRIGGARQPEHLSLGSMPVDEFDTNRVFRVVPRVRKAMQGRMIPNLYVEDIPFYEGGRGVHPVEKGYNRALLRKYFRDVVDPVTRASYDLRGQTTRGTFGANAESNIGKQCRSLADMLGPALGKPKQTQVVAFEEYEVHCQVALEMLVDLLELQ